MAPLVRTFDKANIPANDYHSLSISTVLIESPRVANGITGEMTMLRDTYATNAYLADVCSYLGIDAYIQLLHSANGIIPPRLKAITVEAIIGAVYLDCGKDIATVRRLILHLEIVPIQEFQYPEQVRRINLSHIILPLQMLIEPLARICLGVLIYPYQHMP